MLGVMLHAVASSMQFAPQKRHAIVLVSTHVEQSVNTAQGASSGGVGAGVGRGVGAGVGRGVGASVGAGVGALVGHTPLAPMRNGDSASHESALATHEPKSTLAAR